MADGKRDRETGTAEMAVEYCRRNPGWNTLTAITVDTGSKSRITMANLRTPLENETLVARRYRSGTASYVGLVAYNMPPIPRMPDEKSGRFGRLWFYIVTYLRRHPGRRTARDIAGGIGKYAESIGICAPASVVASQIHANNTGEIIVHFRDSPNLRNRYEYNPDYPGTGPAERTDTAVMRNTGTDGTYPPGPETETLS